MKTLQKQLFRTLVPRAVATAGLLLGFLVAAQAQTSWKFMIVGDTRGTSSSDQINTVIVQELATEIVGQGVKFVLVPGDLVNSGTLSAFQTWKQLMAPVYNAGIGVFPVIGNHDTADVPGFMQVFGADLPDNGPSGEINRTYAFSYGNVLILGLDTYVNPGRVNQSWINSILAANTFPHVFAFGHMPAFKASHTDCLDDYPTQRDAFWNSLRNAGSRAYFCGHDHFYDHARVDDRDGNLDNDVHQLIVGGGGAPLTGGFAYDGANTTWNPVALYHDMQYGYTVVEVNDMTVTMTYWHRTGANTYVATSEVWSYTAGGGPATPPAPVGLTATAGNTQVALAWQPSAGATSYNVNRSTGSSGGPWTTIATGVSTPAYVDTQLQNGTIYYYAVTALNDAGESASSSYVSATPQPPLAPPQAPATLTATSSRKSQVRLSWSASTGATSYNVKRALVTGGVVGAYSTIKSGVTATTYTDNKASSTKTFSYVVTALNAAGESPYSPAATVTVAAGTAR